jgi:hypothetical protein
LPARFYAAHARHVYVEEYYVEWTSLDFPESVLTIRSLSGIES